MPKVPGRQYSAVGVYIFAGGFTVGVKSAGFDVKCHLEGDKYGVSTFKANYPAIPVYVGKESWPDELPGGKVDFIYGNPPCAAWSGNNAASHKAGSWEKDPRVNCTRHHFGLLEKHRPKVWAWESVCAAPAKGKALVDELTGKAMAMGYSVSQVFHEAMYLGVPQTRKRWFLVCHNVEFFPEEPDWDGVESAVAALKAVQPCKTIAFDSRMNKDVYAKHLPKMKPGMRLRALFQKVLHPDPAKRVIKENGHIKGCPGFGHVKLKDTGPATATVGYSMIHPTKDRFLSVREVAVLAGFPASYQFLGGELGAQQLDLIARGVCPPVGAWLARSVKQSLDKNVKVKKPTARVYDFRVKGIPVTINNGV